MKAVKKEVLKIKKDDTIKKIQKILIGYFLEDSVRIIDKTMIICPVGTFIHEDDEWIFDLDFFYMTDNIDTLSLMSLIKDIVKKGIDLMFSTGYHSVFNEDDICCGILFEDDIVDYAEDSDCDYEEALEELSNELIEEYKKEPNKKEIKTKESIQ